MVIAPKPTQEELTNLRNRTEQVLGYARIFLDEIRALPSVGGDPFDRAHQEAFPMMLLAGLAAFLQELATIYGTGLTREGVSLGSIRKVLLQQGRVSAEVAQVHQLQGNPASWLSQAKAVRDFGVHIAGVPRHYFVGGENHGEVHITDPATGSRIPGDFRDVFAQWLTDMSALIAALRATALATNGL